VPEARRLQEVQCRFSLDLQNDLSLVYDVETVEFNDLL
jgi:hypothetical protein